MPVKIVFDMRAIMPVMIMFVVTAVETVGDISGVMEGGMNREPTDKELSGGVICDGLGSSFAALFGVLPNTSFSQNVGLVAMTKVVNRMALASGAIFLILCGLIPKLGALISIMPQAVLGGAAVMMFSSIVVSGIQLITKEKMTRVSLPSSRWLWVLATAWVPTAVFWHRLRTLTADLRRVRHRSGCVRGDPAECAAAEG